MHHGGEVLIGPDNNVYVVIGDIEGRLDNKTKTRAQNYKDGTAPDGRSGILRITQDGKPVGKGILGDSYPLNLYYAYGIRNSFGMDFDPVTGNLWDTENGPDHGDEINLVKPGFNSGFHVVDGMPGNKFNPHRDLVDFNGKGKYSDPEFVWNRTVGPTAIKFLNSDKYGKEYEDDMFVADINNGNIYHFDLDKNREKLVLNGPLDDKIANNPKELENIIFGKGFVGITDLQIGPDGYLYILGNQSIYRIVPSM
jgi:glucose/arabinose dehydrogenase